MLLVELMLLLEACCPFARLLEPDVEYGRHAAVAALEVAIPLCGRRAALLLIAVASLNTAARSQAILEDEEREKAIVVVMVKKSRADGD